MVIDIKLCRFENVTWGFRLVGGADFEIPLTVVKVAPGSIADEAGLRVGDVIVRINDIAASPLSHDEAHKIITKCGNVFYFGVFREEQEQHTESTPVADQFSIGFERPTLANISDSYPERSPTRSPISFIDSIPHDDGRPCSAVSDTKIADEEIAAVMSGESEVLKDHNVIGIFPKPGVCHSSEVLRHLNEEAIKTKSEKEKESKKWTTFLQKPNRPIPKSKADIEAEARKLNAYKVKIGRQASHAVTPDIVVEKHEPEIIANEVTQQLDEQEKEEKEMPPTDSEVPNLEESAELRNEIINDQNNISIADDSASLNGFEDNQNIADQEKEEEEDDDEGTEEIFSFAADSSIQLEGTKKSEDELMLEKQLGDVQRQLLALSTLPSTIQATLDAVTKQLSELLPTFKLQQQSVEHINGVKAFEPKIESNDIEEPTKMEQNDETTTTTTTTTERETIELSDEKREEDEVEIITVKVGKEGATTNVERNSEDLECYATVKMAQNRCVAKEETRKMEEEQNIKKQKKHDVIEELEGRLECEHGSKRSKKAFGPLVPQERPLVLPGGRRWYRPKDAYNDEFIAETLSAQAELITGSTLGCTYESPLLGYDEREYNSASVAIQLENGRVNFMKYQKPEKKIDLEKSEVYKVVHHLDRRPIRGIEVRPPVVAAEADIRKAIHL